MVKAKSTGQQKCTNLSILIEDKMTKYIVNESKQNIGVFQGKYHLIPIGAGLLWTTKKQTEKKSKEAKRRGWISVQLVEPAASEPLSRTCPFRLPDGGQCNDSW